ncbi:hypothetical protein SAMN04488109_1766 [Chryseolinea serpens]|uniref:Nitrate and nitrite sensing n=1 Tax=Chryseolinea serpens TaxID=947013 RepID=A0A1M5MIU9_9BACT|nr:hypothetical protein [Chryseolinea serpens]SHG77176.1 hypothetical protein SAMN04488109_1766 [Chryseolinea serpens]
MELLKQYLPVVTLMIGWALSQLSDFFKVNREDRRRIKKTIFYLLEVRHQLGFLTGIHKTFKANTPFLRKKLATQLPSDISDEQFFQAISPLLTLIAKNRSILPEEDLRALSSNYSKTVEGLSEIDPVLAYRLQGRQGIQNLLNNLSETTKQSISQLTGELGEGGQFDKAMQTVSPKVISEMVNDLQDIIFQLSKKVDRPTRSATRKLLAKSENRELENRSFEEFMNKILADIDFSVTTRG